jgi:hypothetical protein
MRGDSEQTKHEAWLQEGNPEDNRKPNPGFRKSAEHPNPGDPTKAELQDYSNARHFWKTKKKKKCAEVNPEREILSRGGRQREEE